MRIVFVSPKAWLVATRRAGIHGGAELQVTRLARGLAARGHDVVIMTEGEPERPAEAVEGVRVKQAWSAEGGLPFFGIFGQGKSLNAAITAEKPHVVLLRAASPFVSFLADQARREGHRFLFMVSNDSQLDGRYEATSNFRDRDLWHKGLKKAHGVITQTADQTKKLKERFGIEGFHVPSAIAPTPDPAPAIIPEHVFWAGRFEEPKRPHLLLEIARKAPELPFKVAGWVPAKSDYAARFLAEAKELPNVELVGRLGYDAMDTTYMKSIALLSTAGPEGICNTFLESWRLGLPVISLTADPDEVICRYDLGLHSDDTGKVVDQLHSLRDDFTRRAIVSGNAWRYMKQHDERAVVDRLETYLKTAVA
ncbi:MAG TPA: glycosyltransferase family 4 protein [Candidatus Eisenbacteria bacterium]